MFRYTRSQRHQSQFHLRYGFERWEESSRDLRRWIQGEGSGSGGEGSRSGGKDSDSVKPLKRRAGNSGHICPRLVTQKEEAVLLTLSPTLDQSNPSV